ncbi:hypothetical protein BDY19DRAFT_64803 [Irpex rosettiformis]|uniref:Uncharacterized protein n=1 Tax=Irpex rosettiformis TaxID=378272 RepID=A0ACB8UNJ4_9APHY|nr:hypothetical protein BDY19DRAFT_64803 [Irpex rosettiformis]
MYGKFPVEVTDVVLTKTQALRAPTNEELLTMWNHPEVVRQHLSTMSEPTAATQIKGPALRGRLALAKHLHKKVTEMKEAVLPRDSQVLNTVWAEKSYKRKFAIWNSFPINRLPVEILQEIFRFIILCVADTSRVTANRLLLTSVCQFWRNVALSDKILWNTVYFDDAAPWTRSLAFVERAASAKLDIRIDEPRARPRRRRNVNDSTPSTPHTAPHSITPEQMDSLLDVILSKYSQLRIIIVVVDRWDTSRTVMRRFAAAGEAVSLERFEIHRGSAVSATWIPEPHDPTEAFQPYALCDGSTPKLTWLCLSGINIDWKRFSPLELTTLDLRRIPHGVLPDGESFRRVLASSPNLRRLSMANAGPQLDSSDASPSKPIDLPALRELLIGDCAVDYAMRCLSQLNAPNVICLTLLNMIEISQPSLFTQLTGRYPKVEILSAYTLDIHSTTENKAAIVKWLDSMPKLTLIKIAQMPVQYIECFMEDPRQYDEEPAKSETEDATQKRIIAPGLTGFHVTHMPKEAIFRFIDRRKQLGVPLKNFYTPSMFAELGLRPEGLQVIRNAGVEVKVMYQNMATNEEQHLLGRM